MDGGNKQVLTVPEAMVRVGYALSHINPEVRELLVHELEERAAQIRPFQPEMGPLGARQFE